MYTASFRAARVGVRGSGGGSVRNTGSVVVEDEPGAEGVDGAEHSSGRVQISNISPLTGDKTARESSLKDTKRRDGTLGLHVHSILCISQLNDNMSRLERVGIKAKFTRDHIPDII